MTTFCFAAGRLEVVIPQRSATRRRSFCRSAKRDRQAMWQRKLRSRPDKHFPTNLAAKAFRYRGKRPRLCRVPRSRPELRDDCDRLAHRVGILPQLDTQSRPPGPSRLGARCSRSWRYFFSLHTKRKPIRGSINTIRDSIVDQGVTVNGLLWLRFFGLAFAIV